MLQDIADWLQNEAEERMKQALGRKDGADCMRNASKSELKAGKRLAENMSGYKLRGVTTDVESNKQHVATQDRIAAKLESQARQLSAWADYLISLRAGRTS